MKLIKMAIPNAEISDNRDNGPQLQVGTSMISILDYMYVQLDFCFFLHSPSTESAIPLVSLELECSVYDLYLLFKISYPFTLKT